MDSATGRAGQGRAWESSTSRKGLCAVLRTVTHTRTYTCTTHNND